MKLASVIADGLVPASTDGCDVMGSINKILSCVTSFLTHDLMRNTKNKKNKEEQEQERGDYLFLSFLY